MAKMTDKERFDRATVLLPAGDVADAVTVEPPDDIEDSFDEWRDTLINQEKQGSVRAFRLPLDSNNNPIANAKNQTVLGTWPVDAYSLDDLCEKLRREFMLPHENFLAVRLLGTMQGERGVRFNKVVTLQRPNRGESSQADPRTDSVTAIMHAIGESNSRMLQMIEQLRQPIPQAPATDPMQTVIGLMGAMAGMMGQLQGIAKPAGGSAIGQLKEMAEVMAIMNDMRGDSGGGSGDGIADIIKAISPMAGPVLQMAAHAQANQQPAPQRRLPPPAAVSRPVAAPQPVPPVAVRPMPAPAPAAADPFFTAPSNPADFPQPISTVENTGETMIGEMAQIVSAFVSIAENGSDASEAADLFFDETMLNLPDDKYGQLCAFIEKPNAISSMAILNKNVNTHRPWFETALERIKARIAAENLEASNAAGE